MPGSELLKPEDNRESKLTQRIAERMGGRRSQAQGRRWEWGVVQFLRLHGFNRARRVNEADGFNHGWDIIVEDMPEMVIQCKATKQSRDLLAGLNQARKHNPGALFWVCFHSWRREGKQAKIRVAYSSRPEGPPSITDPKGFALVLKRAHARGEYPEA